MDISQTKQEGLQTEFKVVIPASTIEEKIENRLAELVNNQPLPGFPRGNISARARRIKMQAMRTKMAATLHNSAVEEQLKEGVAATIKDHQLYSSPTISNLISEPGKDVSFSLSFIKMPEISNPDWQSINIEKPVVTFSKEEIQDQLQKEREAAASFEDRDAGQDSEPTDVMLLELVSITAGTEEVHLEPIIHTHYRGVNEHVIFKDKEQLSAKRAGMELTIDAGIPQEIKLYGEQYGQLFSYIGQQVIIKTKIASVKKMILPELTDPKFLERLGCTTVEEIDQKIEEQLSRRMTPEVYTLLKIRLFNKLESSLHYELPQALLDKEINNLQHYFSSSQREGDAGGATDQTLIDKLASRRARLALFIYHYANQENIKVTDNDIRAKIIDEARKSPWMSKEIIQFYQSNQDAVSQLSSQLAEDKVVERILRKIKIIETPVSTATFESLMDAESVVQ